MLKTAFLTHEEGLKGDEKLDFEVAQDHTKGDGYWIEEIDEETFFQGHAAAIWLRLNGKAVRIGEFGILHPSVLEKFELRFVSLPRYFPARGEFLERNVLTQNTGTQ
jgi:phenylalanyl-tRNA synthetase beta chain